MISPVGDGKLLSYALLPFPVSPCYQFGASHVSTVVFLAQFDNFEVFIYVILSYHLAPHVHLRKRQTDIVGELRVLHDTSVWSIITIGSHNASRPTRYVFGALCAPSALMTWLLMSFPPVVMGTTVLLGHTLILIVDVRMRTFADSSID